MRIAWVTDPHLNFIGHRKTIEFALDCSAKSDACVITGDIGEAGSVVPLLRAFRKFYEKPVYFVLGNHDFYGGSFESVGRDVRAAFGDDWLEQGRIFSLAHGVELCGVDGWYDARLGNAEGSNVNLNDWFTISELVRAKAHGRLLDELRRMGLRAAEHARRTLERTIAKRVIFATHVPPFAESSVYNGKQSDDDWLPWFSCRALGGTLLRWAEENPDRQLTVWCGHSHGRATFSPLPNLTVLTGAAEYGDPAIELVEELCPASPA